MLIGEDVRPSNILMQLHQYSLLELPHDDLHRCLGPRQFERLRTLSGNDPAPHGPGYLALPASLDKLERKCRTGKVAIIDFSHGFHLSSPPEYSGWHRQYAAPELIFTKASSRHIQDIWALACTIYEIRTQKQLFSEYQDYTSLIQQMELWFGPLPLEYRQTANAFLEEDGERRSNPIDKTESSSSAKQMKKRYSDPSQLLSLSIDEEHQQRQRLLEVLGTTEWSQPLQASLSEERHCYAPERVYTGYTSSEDSDSDTSSPETMIPDEGSEDEDPRGNLYLLLDPDYRGVGNEDAVSEDSGQGEESKSISPRPQTASGSEHVENERQLVEATSPTEGSIASQDNEASSSNINRNTAESTSPESSRKRDSSASTQGRESKRRRASDNSSQRKGELVEQVVRMSKEEVILLSDLLMRMFKHDPKERIDIDTVVAHEFWGDRRNDWGINPDDLIEQIPDPISSRTRNRAPKTEEQRSKAEGEST